MLCFDVICLTLDTTSQSKKPKTEEPKASVNRTATDFGNFKCTVRRSRIGMKTYETATAIMVRDRHGNNEGHEHGSQPVERETDQDYG